MEKRYETVAQSLIEQIEQGVYKPGDRLPGVRQLGRQYGVSISTILQAHQLLEDQGRIEARARSGYYVRVNGWNPPQQPSVSEPEPGPTTVTGQTLALRLVKATHSPEIVQLGAAVPDEVFLPARAINRTLAAVARREGSRLARYEFPPGVPALRQQIARRMADAGCQIRPDDIVVTSGCQEALRLCLQAVAEPGDVIAIESPTFYGLLQVIESLGLKALEIPTHPEEGISLDALTLALEQWPVKACALVPSFSNPLGYCMSAAKKAALVSLLSGRGIPLIEDDVCGELGFQYSRPMAAKAFDREGLVLYCSSFSKTLSPGLRVGWVVGGRFQRRIEYLKYVTNLAAPTLAQVAIAEYLERGGYDRYLRQVRDDYSRCVQKAIQVVGKYFPDGTKVTFPLGGFVIWVEMPQAVDSLELHRQALQYKISVAPGPLFSATQKYTNFIRLNCAHPWDERMDGSLMTLGRLANELGG